MTTTAKASSNYYRQIKLGPAIGDWTDYRPDADESPLRTAQQLPVAFDSLSVPQLKLALKLHYHLADRLTTQLSQGLDIKVELHSVDVLQIPYNAFVSNLTEDLIQSRWQVGRWGWFHMLMDWSFAGVVIDRLVGGTGKDSGRNAEFSELELDILDAQMTEFVAPYSSIWHPVIDPQEIALSFAHGSLKKDSRYSGRAATIVFGFDFDFGDAGHHRISMAYPNITLKNLLTAYEKTHQTIQQRVHFNSETLESILVPFKSVLGKTKLTMAEVSALQAGDVIPLNLALGSPIEILIDDAVSMRGVAGIRHNNVAVQITDNPELHEKLKSFVVRDRQVPESPSDYISVPGTKSVGSSKPAPTQLSFFSDQSPAPIDPPAMLPPEPVFEPEYSAPPVVESVTPPAPALEPQPMPETPVIVDELEEDPWSSDESDLLADEPDLDSESESGHDKIMSEAELQPEAELADSELDDHLDDEELLDTEEHLENATAEGDDDDFSWDDLDEDHEK